MARILVVDRKVSLVMELRDNSKTTFDEAIGLSTYSNSKAGVLSYVAIFENLWVLTELYKQVKEANERLTLHDKMAARVYRRGDSRIKNADTTYTNHGGPSSLKKGTCQQSTDG